MTVVDPEQRRFGAHVRRLREVRKLTQEVLARILDLVRVFLRALDEHRDDAR